MSNRVRKHGEIIPLETRQQIARRYHLVTKAINGEFWGSESNSQHSLYVGSYGRNTAISSSDIDILVELPNTLFDSYNNLKGNGQSRLLQSVRKAILNVYPRSDVRADGQVVKISFSDGMDFEIVPAFKNYLGDYRYPDTNHGGSWNSTNPKAEQEAMAKKNSESNGLLYDTCKHLRSIRDNCFSSYHLSGIVIDSFVYEAIGSWGWSSTPENFNPSTQSFEEILLDYYDQHLTPSYGHLSAPGSRDTISTDSSYVCLGKVLHTMVQ